jgi:hypothetical protein
MFFNTPGHSPGERPRQSRRPVRRRAGRRFVRPEVVPLEDRLLPSVFWVTNTNNDGAGSLHQAIADADGNPGSTVAFDIEPGGSATINLTSPLPTIFAPGTVIDGTSQAGWVGQPIITVDGSALAGTFNGLTLTADGCKVKGLVVQHFKFEGIGLYSNNNVIAGDYIGFNGTGVEIANAVSGNLIGGTTFRSRNVITSNFTGVSITESLSGKFRHP